MEKMEFIVAKERKILRIWRSKAISTVLTTMIILVASVVLGIGVIIYGTSLFQTGTLQEVITINGVKLWVNGTNSSGISWGAAAVRNSGDKLVSVDTIQVRGATVPFSNWYVDEDQTRVSVENFQAQYVHNGTNGQDVHEFRDTIDSGGSVTTSCTTDDDITIEYDLDGNLGGGTTDKKTLCLTKASGPTSLSPAQRLIVIFKVPNGIIVSIDSGTPTSVGIFAGRTGAPITTIIGNP